MLFCCILLFKIFNHIIVIKTYGAKIKWETFVLCLYYVCKYKLTTDNKRFIKRANICLNKSEFYRQILILSKTLLIPAHLRSDAMAI